MSQTIVLINLEPWPEGVRQQPKGGATAPSYKHQIRQAEVRAIKLGGGSKGKDQDRPGVGTVRKILIDHRSFAAPIFQGHAAGESHQTTGFLFASAAQ
ncbi:MAG: hypothetical protein LIO94_10825 [Clostridiales bacterium]|nr:hypothetical protein [Clostridiales bacterium]